MKFLPAKKHIDKNAETRMFGARRATAWYLAASPAQLDTIVRAYLAGQARPYYEQRQEFEKDGLAIKARLDLGVGVIDYRGLYRNPGA